MQMLNLNMYYYSIILFLTSFWLSSCQENLSVPEGMNENVRVSLSVSAATPPSPHTGSEVKDAIKKLHILVFEGKTSDIGSITLAYTVKATRQQDNTFIVIFQKSQNARLVVLANADNAKIEQLSKGTRYADISKVLYNDARQQFSAETSVPMFGVINRLEAVHIEEDMPLGTINLIRAVARIDIGVGRYNEETGKWDLTSPDKYFKLTDIEAWSPMNRNFDMPAYDKFVYKADGTPKVNQASGSLDYSATTAVQWKYTGADILTNGIATYCKDIIYLPEAPLEGYTANQSTDRNKRTTLIIGGYLHDPANPTESAVKTWYRIDFTMLTGNTPNGPLFDILRNHLYRISLNVQICGAATAEEAWNVPLVEIGQITMETVSWKDGGIVDAPISPR